MSEPLKMFLNMAKKNDVDETLLNMPVAEETLNNLENFGKDLGEKAERLFKRPLPRPAVPTPNYQESAFVKPKKETTLYNVTNKEKDVPVVTKNSNILKNTSFSVQSFTVSADYKKENKKYSVFAGEKVGFGITKNEGCITKELSTKYNVGNQKVSLEYSYNDPMNSFSVSVFNQKKNSGVTASYSNRNGLNSALSVDNQSASLNCGYDRDCKVCKIEVSAYATTGENYKNPFAGIAGRITF